MSLALAMITFDALEPEPLARWWADRFDAEVKPLDPTFLLVTGGGLPVTLGFQGVPDPTPGKNKVHLDLVVPDIDAEAERLVAAGATNLGERGGAGFRWITLADPDGNQFCVAAQAEA